MVFKNYREFINYILRYYPYEKIISYCVNNRYKWVFLNKGYKIIATRYPTELDIKQYLLCTLSQVCSLKMEGEKITDNDSLRICNIWKLNRDRWMYFSSYFSKDMKTIVINFSYYFYKFSNKSLPKESNYLDPRTSVKFRFREEII